MCGLDGFGARWKGRLGGKAWEAGGEDDHGEDDDDDEAR